MRSTVILMDREQRHFGIALPSWIVDKDNSFLVSMTQFLENLLSLCFGENHNFANVFQSASHYFSDDPHHEGNTLV